MFKGKIKFYKIKTENRNIKTTFLIKKKKSSAHKRGIQTIVLINLLLKAVVYQLYFTISAFIYLFIYFHSV